MPAEAGIHAFLWCGSKGVDGRFRGHDGMWERHGPGLAKVFCGAFFQKSDRLL
jgi:hypothetical protein